MKKLLVGFAALTLAASVSAGETVTGRVVAVLDGDTIIILTPSKQEVRIRLAEIDAPEKNQPFGQVSKRSMSDLAYGREARAECPQTDRYGRSICKVYVDGVYVNQEQITRGLAWVYRQYVSSRSPLFQLEQRARETRIGLWLDSNPTPPWEWRHGGN
ncbi:MAG: nuclease-like protein [Rhodocyclaceae bacterium]|nr:MAG: nuclease-like protein [Rhodocyclaceae bacterium]